MFDIEYQIGLLPRKTQERLKNYKMLSVSERRSLKRKVLQDILSPGTKIKWVAALVAFSVSANQKFLDPEKQLELAATLMGGQLGYYTTKAIQLLRPKVYIANALEESFIAAGSGLLLASIFMANTDREEITENIQITLQTYNIYVCLVYVLPVLVRAIYSDNFDRIYLKS